MFGVKSRLIVKTVIKPLIVLSSQIKSGEAEHEASLFGSRLDAQSALQRQEFSVKHGLFYPDSYHQRQLEVFAKVKVFSICSRITLKPCRMILALLKMYHYPSMFVRLFTTIVPAPQTRIYC